MQRLLIVGMGRSGTTYITQFLGQCGVYLGAVNWAFEHEAAREINDGYLAQHCGARRGLPYGRLPAEEIEPEAGWRARAQEYVAYMDARARAAGSPYWTFKDPRSTILHRLWADQFDVIVGMFRAPQQVVASYLAQRWISGLTPGRIALGYWKRFNRSLLDLHRTWSAAKPVYVLDFNAPMDAQVTALCARLGLELTPRAQALYSPGHNHFDLADLPRDRDARALYAALLKIRMLP
jgi:hypothetical protein